MTTIKPQVLKPQEFKPSETGGGCQRPSRWCLIKAAFGPLLYIFVIVLLAQALGLRPASADTIQKAEAWFNRLTTFQASFTQVSSDGSSAKGTFLLRRPYRSRFDYDEPVPITLITTKTWLHVDDADRQEVVSYPVSETPLRLILSENVRLRRPEVKTTTSSQDGITSVIIEQDDGEAAGRIVFEFDEKPFELRRWVITDANGITTSVFLSNPVKGIDLPASLFVPTNYPDQNGN